MSSDRKESKTAKQLDFGTEIDTPYFRRSVMQKNDTSSNLIELRIDHFLKQENIIHIQIDQQEEYYSIAKNLNFFSLNRRTSASEMLDDSRKSSISSFNLENNTLFLRRKLSINPDKLSSVRGSTD